MNLNPTIWGPPTWFLMFSIILAYPDNPSENDKQNIKNFFIYIGKVLPCQKCRNNFEQQFKNYPLNNDILSKRDLLVNWLLNIYNDTNKTIGKPVVTYEEIVEKTISAYLED